MKHMNLKHRETIEIMLKEQKKFIVKRMYYLTIHSFP